MTEDKWMPLVAEAWQRRCKAESLKPGTKKRQHALECYLQGVLATATATGAMSMDRASQICFLVMVGRGEEFLSDKPDTSLDEEIAEWVDQHYQLHWDSLSPDRQAEFRRRYAESQPVTAE